MTIRKAVQWGAVYAAWLLSCALGMATLLLSRQAVWILLDLRDTDRLVFGVVDRFYLLIATIALIAFIVFAEHYLRQGLLRDRLRERTARILGVGLLVVLGFHGFTKAVVALPPLRIEWVLLAVKCGGGAGLVVYSSRLRRARRAKRAGRSSSANNLC